MELKAPSYRQSSIYVNSLQVYTGLEPSIERAKHWPFLDPLFLALGLMLSDEFKEEVEY